MVSKLVIYSFILLCLCQSCTQKALTPIEFVSYCNNEENGFIKTRVFNTISYSLKYESVELKAIADLYTEKISINKVSVDKIKKEYEGLSYFIFKIENLSADISPIKSIARNESDLAKITQYCQSNLANDFYIESNGAKVPCALFHLEDDYHITNFNTISLAFETKLIDMTKDLTFVFNDPFFENGTIKFNISKEVITKIPKLNYI